MEKYITMSRKEIKHYDIIKKALDRQIKAKEAAQMLKLSIRHIKRLKKKVREEGAEGLIHKNRGKPSNRKIPEFERNKIIELLKNHYNDFGPAFAAEQLFKKSNISRDAKTIRQIMIEEELWKPKRKAQIQYRSWRQRKACFGEMQQYDGSYHHWFEDRAPKCCLLAAIDDATSIVTQAEFTDHEGVFPTFKFWKKYAQKEGKPFSIYVDKFSTYSMNHKLAKENGDTLTQFERAMKELQIDVIHAQSSQAKGRVERLFETLQDRLVKELRLNNISTKTEANEFLEKTFLAEFNTRFGVKPRAKANLHKKLSEPEENKIDSIFSRQYKRKIKNDFTIIYKNKWYQLENNQPVTVCKQNTVIVEEHLEGNILLRFKGKYLSYKVLPEKPEKLFTPWILAKNMRQSPPAKHLWGRFSYGNKFIKTPK